MSDTEDQPIPLICWGPAIESIERATEEKFADSPPLSLDGLEDKDARQRLREYWAGIFQQLRRDTFNVDSSFDSSSHPGPCYLTSPPTPRFNVYLFRKESDLGSCACCGPEVPPAVKLDCPGAGGTGEQGGTTTVDLLQALEDCLYGPGTGEGPVVHGEHDHDGGNTMFAPLVYAATWLRGSSDIPVGKEVCGPWEGEQMVGEVWLYCCEAGEYSETRRRYKVRVEAHRRAWADWEERKKAGKGVPSIAEMVEMLSERSE